MNKERHLIKYAVIIHDSCHFCTHHTQTHRTLSIHTAYTHIHTHSRTQENLLETKELVDKADNQQD